MDDAADGAGAITGTIERARRRGLRLSFVAFERENEWIAATSQRPFEADRVFRLGELSLGEAMGVVDRLEKAGELGRLQGLSRDEQVARLLNRSGRELLVAMREATEDARFDEIIVDEMRHLPSDTARRAYLHICALFQFGVPIRAGVLSRTTGVPFDRFADDILRPAKHVVIEAQDAPWKEPTYSARHRVIADIVFRRAFPTLSERLVEIQLLLANLDSGYRDDSRAFARLINARWLRHRGVEAASAAPIYDLAKRLRPDDGFVLQQEALSYRSADPLLADRLLGDAARMAPDSGAIRHSRAVLILDEAKAAFGFKRADLLQRAETAFRALARTDARSSAPLVSLAEVMLLRAADAESAAERLAFVAAARRELSKALTTELVSSHVLTMSARVEQAAGNLDDAADEYLRAARTAGPDPYVWISCSRFLVGHQGPKAALACLDEALNLSPIDPYINHEYARVLELVDAPDDAAIRRAYSLAIAEPLAGHLPQLDFAIYLYRSGHVDEASHLFDQLRASQLGANVKARVRTWLCDPDGRPQMFRARVVEVGYRRAFLVNPSWPGRVFMHARELVDDERRVGAELDVMVLFNCHGPRATKANQSVGETPSAEGDELTIDP